MLVALPRLCLVGVLLSGAPNAFAQAAPAPSYPVVELQAEGTAQAANDLARVSVVVDQQGANASTEAQTVNRKMAQMLALTKENGAVRGQTGQIQTFPVHDSSGSRITAWRVRAELHLQSRDFTQLSALLGKLQEIGNVTQMVIEPDQPTLQKAKDEAQGVAIAAFQARAELAAKALGKRWRLQKLQLTSDNPSGEPMMRTMQLQSSLAKTAAPPIEGGERTVKVGAAGSIELLD